MGIFIDLTGQKFDRLKVVSRSGKTKCCDSTWICECECGNVKTVASGDLKKGSTKSCGCKRNSVRFDLTGQKFGMLTVIDRAPNSNTNQTRWNCVCECGGYTMSHASHLTGGLSKSCGCVKAVRSAIMGAAKAIDLTGKVFGYLTVINRDENGKHGGVKWNCLCICGTVTSVLAGNLTSGSTKSCACLAISMSAAANRANARDFTGAVFSRLTVIRRVNNEKKGASFWECECECGKTTIIRSDGLITGHAKSCGCLQRELTSARATTHGLTGTAEYYRMTHKRRMGSEPLYVVKHRTRGLISTALKKKGYSKTSKTQEILGCTFDEFKSHIESQFTDGMCWERFSEIHIDHIVPLASAKTIEDILILNHYTNLQPLWAIDNLKKGSKLDYNVYGEVGRHVINPTMIDNSIKIS